MYHDFSNTARSNWKYGYKGRDGLLDAAKNKFEYFKAKETEARQKMAALMTDSRVSPSEKEVTDTRKDIESFATHAEECMVYVHEFERNPDREFLLSLGDVVFFGLAK